jgi:2-polyprenyl-3-methyl-5-hydroxy-6-metoxy-1,4-benzoquinol methylase
LNEHLCAEPKKENAAMNHAEYKTMFDLETFYWWFVARRKLISEVVKSLGKDPESTVLLDVGCGTGLNCSELSKYGKAFGADMSAEALSFGRSRKIENLVLSKAEELQFADETFDVLTALDVLEHTDNDLTVLTEMWRVVKPGGTLVVTVPAYGFLWSEHDEALRHRRRYSAHELRNKLTNAGFEMQRSTYFITLMFFPIFFMRIWQNLTKKSLEAKTSHVILPKWLNSLLIRMLDLERLYLRWSNLPFGVTILATARKPEAASGLAAEVDSVPSRVTSEREKVLAR